MLSAIVGFAFVGMTIANGSAARLTGRASALCFVPVAALILAIVILVSALRRRAAWAGWVATTDAAERREVIDAARAGQPWVGALVAGVVSAVIWLTGAVLVGVARAAVTPQEFVFFLMGLCLLGMLTAGLLALALTARASAARIRDSNT